MRIILAGILLLFTLTSIAQVGDTLKKQTDSLQNDSIKIISTNDSLSHADSIKLTDTLIAILDTVPIQKAQLSSQPLFNKYGDLLNDDPLYNPKYPWWKPAGR